MKGEEINNLLSDFRESIRKYGDTTSYLDRLAIVDKIFGTQAFAVADALELATYLLEKENDIERVQQALEAGFIFDDG